MSKPQPGQVVLDAIDEQVGFNDNVDWDEAKQDVAELRAYRAAFKKMAGAKIAPHGNGWQIPGIHTESNAGLAKAILSARAVEARRKK